MHRVLVGASRACLLAGALLGAQACSLGPAYRRPDVAMPTAWRDSAVAASADWPRADWWRGFGSSQLNDYIAQAQAGNNDIAAVMARVREADAQARIAGAALLPTLAADASA